MQTTKNQNMAGTKVQTSKVWKCPIFPDLARFSGETGSRSLSPVPRVPGLPIGDCARDFNNCSHTQPQMSAIYVTGKIFFERLYLVSGMGTFGAEITVPCTHNSDHSVYNYFSISVQFFSPNGPSFFLPSRFTKYFGQVPVPSLYLWE